MNCFLSQVPTWQPQAGSAVAGYEDGSLATGSSQVMRAFVHSSTFLTVNIHFDK